MGQFVAVEVRNYKSLKTFVVSDFVQVCSDANWIAFGMVSLLMGPLGCDIRTNI